MTALPTVENGQVRAFEPRCENWGQGPWRCRGRLPAPPSPGESSTRQCSARLEEGQRFCGKCGGLVAWGGVAEYNGVQLRHLQRMAISKES